ncbi:iron-containing alcohol dehydrogenase [Wohlfahrtiimonas larvae]
MKNFIYANPTKIIFGKGSIANITSEIPVSSNVLVLYGGGSIRSNGVYDQVMSALSDHTVLEFSGIEANPHYETCLKAVEFIKKNNIDFLLAVGGGSVLDATKFIAAASQFTGNNPWDILVKHGHNIETALPFGAVITLPATGSEMNNGGVITRAATEEKLAFSSTHTFPIFSVLDPETTYSLPIKQISNGIVDAFVHVIEQYLTVNSNKLLLQDYMAESILQVLVQEAPALIQNGYDYDSRANFMWAATWALNGWIACGVEEDWATHMIGHELTALYGLDHAQTLAIILPGLLHIMKIQKSQKIARLGQVIFNIHEDDAERQLDLTIQAIEKFFNAVGIKTCLSDYGLNSEAIAPIVARFADRGWKLGECKNIESEQIKEILELRL